MSASNVTAFSELPAEASAAASAKPRRKAPVVFGVMALLVSSVGGGFYWNGRGKESTDDAFVEAHVANVAPRVAGQVLRVLVRDNQRVQAGDALFELDDRDARVRLDAARADLASAQANVSVAQAQLALTEGNVEATLRQARGGVTQARSMSSSSSATVQQARADVVAAESRLALSELELQRTDALRQGGATSQSNFDARIAARDQAQAALDLARARVTAATSGIANASGSLETAQGRLVAAQTGPQQVEAARAQLAVAQARVAQAQAAVSQAELTLSYFTVRAPIGGVVSRRTVEPGQMVDPARPLLALTALDDVWIVANFKEDQVAHMRQGQKVDIEVDAFDGQQLTGHIDSLSGGTGARFALLPPDNASGNFTKVVQRVPVLVRIDSNPSQLVLRPGLSTYVTAHTGG